MLYHLTRDATAEKLTAAGLDWLCGGGLVRCQCNDGPTGTPGCILADAARVEAARCRWQPDGQEWVPGIVEGLSVGRWHDDPPPEPADLARTEQLQGHAVELADGHRWLVPLARGWAEEDGELRWYTALPQRLTRRDGQWQRGDVLPRFARLWQIAEQWEARWQAAIDAAVAEEDRKDQAEQSRVRCELSLHDAADLAAEVLGANYRLTAAEVSLLGLFADHTPATVLDALIDLPTRAEWIRAQAQKKTPPAPAGVNTPAGGPASTPATAPR